MRVLAIQSSPNRTGLSAQLCQQVLIGAKGQGATIELVHLNYRNVDPCLACRGGWGVCWDGLPCVINDDVPILYQKMAQADIIVLATPVYFRDLSESMKRFLDRIRRMEWPTRADKLLMNKVAAFIVAAGGSGAGTPEALSRFSDYNRYLRFDDQYHLAVKRQNKDLQLKMAVQVGKMLVDYCQSKQVQ